MRVLLISSWLFLLTSATAPIIKTIYGPIGGLEITASDSSKANIYLGIRYANAPDGQQRFERPTLVHKWEPDVYQATKFGAACFPFHEKHMFKTSIYNEDCLYLNILTPAKMAKKAPVLVFIHGGGFEISSTAEYGYKTAVDNFVSKGIIVATVQYRLGPLGFLTFGTSEAPGNIGYWDMTTALEFLHEVLPDFGGDVNKITISGQSAGAAAVSALSFSPHSEVFFQQAIELSGSTFAEYAVSESVVKNSLDLAETLGCYKSGEAKKSRQILDCLRQKTMKEILGGVDKIGPSRVHPNFLKFHPRIDGQFFPYELEQMVKSATKKPVLSGFTTMESGIFVEFKYIMPLWEGIALSEQKRAKYSADDLFTFLAESVATESEHGRKMGPFLEALEKYYIKRDAPATPDNEFYLARYIELLSDMQFVVPGLHDLDLRRANGWPSFFYIIDYVPTVERAKKRVASGAWHAVELRFLFDTIFFSAPTFSEEDRQFQRNFVNSIANFVMNGNPSTETLTWDPVSLDDPLVHAEFTSQVHIRKEFDAEKRKLWLEEIPRLVGSQLLKKTRLPGAQAYNAHTEL